VSEGPEAGSEQQRSGGRDVREVRFRHSPSFPQVIEGIGCSLLVTTYQAGQLVSVGVGPDGLVFSFHHLDQAMGVAVGEDRLAVGSKGQIWFMQESSQLAPGIPPAGTHDRCFLARGSTVTGGIHCHELAWGTDSDGDPELWIVNTLFSCLATLDPEHSFVPRWRPPFVSELAAQDRCHLNGLAMRDGAPAFATVMAQTDEPGGWRKLRNDSGAVLDIATGEPVTTGLAMPHSPRWYGGGLLVLNSGLGTLEAVDISDGSRQAIASVPGYARGLGLYGNLAFVGLSRIRETAIFGGAPIAEHHDELKCGVGVIDLDSGDTVATLEFETGVEEIFDVQVVAGARCLALGGAPGDGDEIWVVPAPGEVPGSAAIPGGGGPTDAEVERWVAEALAAQDSWQGPRALELFQRAAAARPRNAKILNHLGNALQDAGEQGRALECYERASAADPTFAAALQNAGHLLVHRGRIDEGLDRLRRADGLSPAPVNKALIATALPVVYTDEDELRSHRSRIEHELEALARDGLEIDTTDALVPTNFFAAYHGFSDRGLHESLGRIYRGPDLLEGDRSLPARSRGGRPRIGFLSAHFRDHTIGRLNIGRVERLSRDRFEVTVIAARAQQDELSDRFRGAADNYVELPRGVAAAREAIAAQELDLLFFADAGMDTLVTTLAYSRMAPIQVVTWGHPVTTGSPHMDYFLSSELLEAQGADRHYSEKLLRPPSLCTYYERPEAPGPVSRDELGLPEDAHLYVCPQTLFKLQPDLDLIMAEILRRDPAGRVVLIEGRVPAWTELLRERFQRTMPDVADRVLWLASMPRGRFLELLATADVLLDPTRFGGGNTTYEALAIGTPVVTLPGELLRNRITLALLEMAGMEELVVDSPEAYVDLAVALATDRGRREETSARLAASADSLFEDEAEVRDLEACLGELIAQA